MRRAIVGAVVVALALGVAGRAETLRIEGSTTVGPIADAFAEYFKSLNPKLEITVNKNGSGNGATALIENRCDIAAMSRFMSAEEFAKAVANKVYPVAWTISMDGVCVVVHPSNPVKALTGAQVRDIYMGKITNWSQVGGSNTPIVVISRDSSSGTYETFETLIMKKEPMTKSVEYVNANPQAQARVKTTPGAIAYVGLGFLEGVKAVPIDGIAPTKQTVANGTYPLSRPLFLFTNGFPKLGSIPFKFVTFYLTEKGQTLIEAKDFVPLTNY
jgi:phosphate transport system substrate-binding protein